MKPLRFEKLYPLKTRTRSQKGPAARSGHRIVTDGNDVYCYGGYNPSEADVSSNLAPDFPMLRELWKFNCAQRIWTKLETTGAVPVVSASHSALLLGSRLLIFGGTGFPFANVKSNQLYQCELKTREWSVIECTGELPGEIYGHAMIAVHNFVYIYGGTTGFEYSNTIHRLNLDTKVWEPVHAVMPRGAPMPNPSYRHEIVSDGEKLFVFGGGTSTTVDSLEQIWVFHLTTLAWTREPTVADPVAGYPEARKCHSCVNFWSRAFICGGLGSQRHLDDVWSCDLVTMQWKRFELQLPKPVYFHSATLTLAGCMYIFGGVLTVNHLTRSDELYRIWLTVPKLKEIVWDTITPKMSISWTKDALLEAGIPHEFLSRFLLP